MYYRAYIHYTNISIIYIMHTRAHAYTYINIQIHAQLVFLAQSYVILSLIWLLSASMSFAVVHDIFISTVIARAW